MMTALHYHSQDDERPGRSNSLSTPENIDFVHSLILSDRRIGLNGIVDTLRISYERVHHIVHVKLRMKQISAKWMRKCLNANHIPARAETSPSTCAQFENDPNYLNRVISTD